MNKKVLRKVSFLTLCAFANAMFALPHVNAATPKKISDGVWEQTGSGSTPGTTTISFTTGEALAGGDKIIFTFPVTEAPVDSDTSDDTVTLNGATTAHAIDAVDNSITLTVGSAISANTPVTVEMANVLSSYTATTYAQQSVAININNFEKYPYDFGLAIKTNDNTTDVTATVPLFTTLAVDDVTMDLGTLSVASVKEVTQTYEVHSNNRSGVQVYVETDGDLRDAGGLNTIDRITTDAVTAGTEGYGIEVSNFRSDDSVVTLAVEDTDNTLFGSGDDALPTAADGPKEIVDSATTVNKDKFDITYKAAIDGDTVAGEYSQVVTFTIATNA